MFRKILLRICVDHEIWWEFWCKGGTTSVHVRRSCHWDHPWQYIHWSYIIFSSKLTIRIAVISCLRLKNILWCWAWKVTEIAFILCTGLTTIMWCWAWKLTRICFYNMPKGEHYCVMLGMNIQRNAFMSCLRFQHYYVMMGYENLQEFSLISCLWLKSILWCWAWKLTRICLYNMPKSGHYCVMPGMKT